MYLQLTGSAYTSRAIIAGAQRCLNLYPEMTPQAQGEMSVAVDLCTPGLTLLSVAPEYPIRCLYTASSGLLFAVANNGVYYIDYTWKWNLIGRMVGSGAPRYTPASMVDSNLSVLIADGSSDGWTIALTETNAAGTNVAIAPAAYVLTKIDASSNMVTGSVANPTVVPGTTFILQKNGIDYTATASSTDTTAANMAAEIISATSPAQANAAVLNITAYTDNTGHLVIKDTSGAQIEIGPGTANTALGFSDGQYGAYDPGGWTGADRVDFSDTYFIFNQPGTPLFGISGSEAVTFDALDFAGKSDKGDSLVSVAVVHRVLWLLGQYTTEVWYDSGGGGVSALSVNTFPFEELPGTFFSTGCLAKYSVAVADNNLCFLGQNSAGQGIVMLATGYNCVRISTFAIEAAISQYATMSDAIGLMYSQQGHLFYQLSFPTGDQTWVYDLTTHLWHERCWLDTNGIEHRHRANTAASAYNKVVVADWENANLYCYDLNNYTDNFAPIKRLRSFPHQIDQEANRRIIFKQLIANVSVGLADPTTASQVAINTSFDAPDGTLLQAYQATGDIGSVFTQVNSSSNALITGDAMVGTSGNAEYLVSGVPLSANYTVTFTAVPDSYSSMALSSMYVIARATPTYQGYQMQIQGTGSRYAVSLTVMPNSEGTINVNAGAITSGSFICNMTLYGTSITITVQRTQDGLWLAPGGIWAAGEVNCIAIIDANYTLPGRVLLGGNW